MFLSERPPHIETRMTLYYINLHKAFGNDGTMDDFRADNVAAKIKTIRAMRPDLEKTPFAEWLATTIALRLFKQPEVTREDVLKTLEGVPFLYGNYMEGTKRPKGLRKQKNKACYKNALELAASNKTLKYVEGYANNLIVCEHAWCVDADGKVVDPTWRDPEKCQYLGVILDLDKVYEWTCRNKVYGIFPSLWNRKVTISEIIESLK